MYIGTLLVQPTSIKYSYHFTVYLLLQAGHSMSDFDLMNIVKVCHDIAVNSSPWLDIIGTGRLVRLSWCGWFTNEFENVQSKLTNFTTTYSKRRWQLLQLHIDSVKGKRQKFYSSGEVPPTQQDFPQWTPNNRSNHRITGSSARSKQGEKESKIILLLVKEVI